MDVDVWLLFRSLSLTLVSLVGMHDLINPWPKAGPLLLLTPIIIIINQLEPCRTEQATTPAHCLNLVFIVCGSSRGPNRVWGLPRGEGVSLSDVVDEDDVVEMESNEDLDDVTEL